MKKRAFTIKEDHPRVVEFINRHADNFTDQFTRCYQDHFVNNHFEEAADIMAKRIKESMSKFKDNEISIKRVK